MRRWLAVLLVLVLALAGGCTPQELQEPSDSQAEPAPVSSAPTEPGSAVVRLSQAVSGELQCLKSRGGRCLAVYGVAGNVCEAALYDLQTGELLGMQTLPDGQYEAALLPDGTAAVLDEKTGRALRYDASLSRCLRQEAGWGSQWLLEDTGFLWSLGPCGQVWRVDLCTGTRQE